MNRLSRERRHQILASLVEGAGMRATARINRCSLNTVTRLLVNAGQAAWEHHDRVVRDVRAKNIQCDEIWSFCYAKRVNAPLIKGNPDWAGDVWTWLAMDPDSKLIVSFAVGNRTADEATALMADLYDRLDEDTVQLSTDCFPAYALAVEETFGRKVDFG